MQQNACDRPNSCFGNALIEQSYKVSLTFFEERRFALLETNSFSYKQTVNHFCGPLSEIVESLVELVMTVLLQGWGRSKHDRLATR
jgi:hypothetical protein